MLRQISSSRRLGGRFSIRILLPVALVTAVAIGLAAFSLFWAVRQSDEVSVERQLRTTQRTIGALVEELAQ